MSIPVPYLLAIGLTAGVAGWVLSGDIIEGGRVDSNPVTIAERNAEADEKLFKVQAELFTAEERTPSLEVRGSTEASGKVAIRSETVGLLNQRHVQKGQWVEAGDLICTLNVGAREATVQQMEAQLKKAEIDHQGAIRLVKDGFATQTRLNTDKAAMDAARAELKSAKIELERTRIKAPIAGFVQDPFAKVGDMLQVGDVCANVVEPGTMTMVTQISERHVGGVHIGSEARVRLITGETVVGAVKYIAPSADIETRTFRMEIAVPNSDNQIRDGVTAMASIILPSNEAHKVPSSVLTLDDLGRLGVRAVDGQGLVSFVPVEVLDDELDGVWVKGLPESIKIITRGQEYVIAGQRVDAVVKTAEAK